MIENDVCDVNILNKVFTGYMLVCIVMRVVEIQVIVRKINSKVGQPSGYQCK